MANARSLPSLSATLLLIGASAHPLVGCSSSEAADPQPSATGGATGQDSGAGGTAPDGSTGGTKEAGTGGSGQDPFANPAFTGIDTSIVPAGVAPTGCENGLDLATGKLTITLSAAAPVVLIGVNGTEIRANGVTCTASGGAKATVENTSSVWINGSDADETVIVDLSTGSFGSKILGKDGGIHVDLGPGTDTFQLRATADKDTIRVGKSGAGLAIGLVASSAGEIFVAGGERLTASLGPGGDEFRAGADAGFDAPCDIPVAVYGDADDDVVEGGSGNDTLNGGAGDDTFDEGDAKNGSDIINGGDDKQNTITYARRTGSIEVTLCRSNGVDGCVAPVCDCEANDGQSGENDNLINLRHYIGGSGSDTVTGTTDDEVLEGGEGADYLYGMAGADTLLGGLGEDTLDSGDDTVKDIIDCGDGDADIGVGNPEDEMTNCELN